MNEVKRKRQRKEDKEASSNDDEANSMEGENSPSRERKDLKGAITSLMLLDEQEKCDQEEENKVSGEEMQLFETNHKERAKTMGEYYSNFQACYEEIRETEQTKRRKSRAIGGAVALSVASNGLASEGSKETKQGSSGGQGQQRRIWVKDREKAWWDDCNRPEFPEVEFKKAFRMSKSTFDMICEDLNSVIAKEDTALRSAIPVRQRVAVCIWRLATGEPLRLVSKRFGLGISTCHKLVLEVCLAIRNVLMPKYLQWPDDDGLSKLKNEFESISDIPNVVGSMYTTHIPIIAPKISVAAYFNKRHTERNQKTSYSITLQGVVDPKGVFTDVCIGWPGSMPDDQVLEKSALYQRANGGLLKDMWIVGSSGYPLMDWILVPYIQQNLTWTQHAFNEKIGEIQTIVKDAFARLKGRWICLQKRTEVKLQDLPIVLGACCVLHNICEMRGEEMDPELKVELIDDEMIPEVALKSASSVKARDTIAHNLLHHRRAGTGFL
uniref:DDE Tnp4 domain-containing protein n=1 Tax=Rhizophora mucronata TaxID=61149 RepID=A0A2P2QT00_RHIMU